MYWKFRQSGFLEQGTNQAVTTNYRILSDLHIGHNASIIKNPIALRELCRGAEHIVFNGDALEQKYSDSPAHKKRPVVSYTDLDKMLRSWGVETTFITGNHDPEISDTHYLELNNQEIFITHGDGVLDNIAPWSHNIRAIAAIVDKHAKQLRPDHSLNEFLQMLKTASIEAHRLTIDFDPTIWGKATMFLKQAWPPTRVLEILKAWKQTPQLTQRLVRKFKIPAKFAIIGHTHKPGIWHLDDLTVINTGSFFSWPGSLAVDITSDSLLVRRISKSSTGCSLGRLIFDAPLSQTSAGLASKAKHSQAIKADLR